MRGRETKSDAKNLSSRIDYVPVTRPTTVHEVVVGDADGVPQEMVVVANCVGVLLVENCMFPMVVEDWNIVMFVPAPVPPYVI